MTADELIYKREVKKIKRDFYNDIDRINLMLKFVTNKDLKVALNNLLLIVESNCQ